MFTQDQFWNVINWLVLKEYRVCPDYVVGPDDRLYWLDSQSDIDALYQLFLEDTNTESL